MMIDFLGVSPADQASIRRFFDALVAADASKDASRTLALLARNVVIEIDGIGTLDRAGCERYLRDQALQPEDSRIDYPTLYVEFKDGVFRVEGTYKGWVGGRLEYAGSIEMRLARDGDGFRIARERMIPSLHGGESL